MLFGFSIDLKKINLFKANMYVFGVFLILYMLSSVRAIDRDYSKIYSIDNFNVSDVPEKSLMHVTGKLRGDLLTDSQFLLKNYPGIKLLRVVETLSIIDSASNELHWLGSSVGNKVISSQEQLQLEVENSNFLEFVEFKPEIYYINNIEVEKSLLNFIENNLTINMLDLEEEDVFFGTYDYKLDNNYIYLSNKDKYEAGDKRLYYLIYDSRVIDIYLNKKNNGKLYYDKLANIFGSYYIKILSINENFDTVDDILFFKKNFYYVLILLIFLMVIHPFVQLIEVLLLNQFLHSPILSRFFVKTLFASGLVVMFLLNYFDMPWILQFANLLLLIFTLKIVNLIKAF